MDSRRPPGSASPSGGVYGLGTDDQGRDSVAARGAFGLPLPSPLPACDADMPDHGTGAARNRAGAPIGLSPQRCRRVGDWSDHLTGFRGAANFRALASAEPRTKDTGAALSIFPQEDS
jgi:hypothetical protein